MSGAIFLLKRMVHTEHSFPVCALWIWPLFLYRWRCITISWEDIGKMYLFKEVVPVLIIYFCRFDLMKFHCNKDVNILMVQAFVWHWGRLTEAGLLYVDQCVGKALLPVRLLAMIMIDKKFKYFVSNKVLYKAPMIDELLTTHQLDLLNL